VEPAGIRPAHRDRLPRAAARTASTRAAITDHWILNLIDRVLEVCRDPVPARSARLGWRCGSTQVLGPEDAAAPLAAPGARIAVTDLLP
jgi:hypothetical protein